MLHPLRKSSVFRRRRPLVGCKVMCDARAIVDKDFVINDAGLALISYYEGVRLEAYADSEGVYTIGIGCTHYPSGTPVRKGDTCTGEQALDFLSHDIEWDASDYVHKFTDGLNENEFSALTSFCFNCGAGTLRRLLALPGSVADNLLIYDSRHTLGPGKNLGLMRRRRSERALYLGEPWEPYKNWMPEAPIKSIDPD